MKSTNSKTRTRIPRMIKALAALGMGAAVSILPAVPANASSLWWPHVDILCWGEHVDPQTISGRDGNDIFFGTYGHCDRVGPHGEQVFQSMELWTELQKEDVNWGPWPNTFYTVRESAPLWTLENSRTVTWQVPCYEVGPGSYRVISHMRVTLVDGRTEEVARASSVETDNC